MFVVVYHHISNPERFQEAVLLTKIPEELKLHSSLPNENYTEVVCLWEADEERNVKNFVEDTVGYYSQNNYFAVGVKKAVGLPK